MMRAPLGRLEPEQDAYRVEADERFSMAGRMCSRDVELARLSLQADVRAHRRREKVATELRAMKLA